MSYSILIADDESEILEVLELYLENDGLSVIKANNGLEALNAVNQEKIDMAIIDIMMPEIDGLRLLKKIREKSNIPVLILSAKGCDNDKIIGLGLGADDYVSKPFNPLEIVARVNAQLRRFYNLNPDKIHKVSKIIKIGDIELNTDENTLKHKDKYIELTYREYRIIKLLMESPGRIFTKKQIFENAWDEYFVEDDSTIMVHISNIRSKIEDDARKPVYLKTIKGLGYKFEKKVVFDE
ncbi:response regulator transcription factor [Clostridium sp. UBA6640]|uniref:response regulator transcription factor n=1 Tax=Clostridium sp. UBA6640 TaxID=1946370 RepID=UPI0025C5BAE3|nr:response regulator transcription factor [Clostridium sp. UBA6640]